MSDETPVQPPALRVEREQAGFIFREEATSGAWLWAHRNALGQVVD
jgi:hypothetical protein